MSAAGAKQVWRQFRRRVLGKVALGIVGALALVAVFADLLASNLPIAVRVDGRTHWLPAITDPPALRSETVASLRAKTSSQPDSWLWPPLVPFGPNQTSLGEPLAPPSPRHWLGTDEIGRDVFARIVHGARISLFVGLFAVGIYILIGTALGAAAGYFGGRVDSLISRATEVMLSFPTFFLVLAVLGILRVRTLLPIVVVIGLTRWTEVSRLVRAEVLRLRAQDFVHASRALGASDLRVITRHLIPNALGPVLVSAPFGIAGAILLETALSFLGFGVPPPAPSWGELLTQAHRYVTYPGAWWLTLFPGLAIFITVTSFNLVGEGLRDALDPRLR